MFFVLTNKYLASGRYGNMKINSFFIIKVQKRDR